MISFIGALYVSLGASIGAITRWWLGIILNSVFPTLPLGTLVANLIGGFLMGIIMAITRNHAYVSEASRLAITTGFLGGLTTFSTFSAETVTLLMHHEYFWSFIIILGHVAGTILATFGGIYTIKLLTLGGI